MESTKMDNIFISRFENGSFLLHWANNSPIDGFIAKNRISLSIMMFKLLIKSIFGKESGRIFDNGE